jgi:hypothetical protein
MGYKKRTVRNTGEIIDEIPESMSENVPEVVSEMPMSQPEIDDAETQRKQAIADKRRASLALARSKIIPKSTLKKQADEAVKATADAVKVKDDEIKIKQEETDAMRLKYERDRVKQLEDSLMTLQKLIADKPSQSGSFYETKPYPIVNPPVELPPIKEKYKRPSRAKSVVSERAMDKPSQQTERGSSYGTKHDIPARQERTLQPEKIIPKKSVEPKITRTSATPTETLIDKSYGEQLQERLRNQAINKIMNDTFGGF